MNYNLSPEGAETFPELKQRAGRVFEFLEERHKHGESILLVALGDLGKMLYAAYYDLEWQDVLRAFNFGNSERILCSPEVSSPTPDQTHVFSIKQFNS